MKKLVVGCAVVFLVAVLLSPVTSQPGPGRGGKTKREGPIGKIVPVSPSVPVPPSPKWEYSVLTRDGIAKAGKGDFRAGLNKLGAEGWELVTVETPPGTPVQGARPADYYFKRARSAGPRVEAPRVSPGKGRGLSAGPAKPMIRVLRLKNAKAADLVKIFRDVYEDNRAGPRLTSDLRTNSLIVVGTDEQIIEVARLMAELDEPEAEVRETKKFGVKEKRK